MDRHIALGNTIKMISNNRIGGYLVRFTSQDDPDLVGEFFTADTDFILDTYPIENAPVLYNHGLDETVGVKGIGRIDTMRVDEQGIYAEAQLTPELWGEAQKRESEAYIEQVRKLIEEGRIGWSSGALPQSVKVADNGHIEQWGIIEGSATIAPAGGLGYTRIQSVKSLDSWLREQRAIANVNYSTLITQGAIKMTLDELMSMLRDALAPLFEDADRMMEEDEDTERMMADDDKASGYDDNKMEDEEAQKAVLNRVAEMIKSIADSHEEPDYDKIVKSYVDKNVGTLVEQYMTERLNRATARKTAMQNALANAKASAQRNAPAQPRGTGYSAKRVELGDDLRFAHLSAEDMQLGYLQLQATLPKSLQSNPHVHAVSDDYLTHMAQKSIAKLERNPFADIRDQLAVKSALPFKADEINATNIAGQGQEWVSSMYGSTLWERARNEVALLRELRSRGLFEQEIPQGHQSIVIPTEQADPIAYSTPEANDLDATGRLEVTGNISFFGTGNITMTPGKIMIAAATSTELIEDSIIPVLPNMSRQINDAMLERLEQALINGDRTTTASTNINLIDGTPGTGIERPYYLAVNGLRKYPLVTNTDYAQSAGGTLSIDLYRQLITKFNPEVQARVRNLLYITDVYTHNATLGLSEVEDNRFTQGRVENGRVLSLYGIDLMTTGFLGLANSAGKNSATASNNTLGQALLVHAPYWAFGFKRQVNFETQRHPLSDATVAVASMRFGFEARGADAAAVLYNVGV